MSDPTTPAGSPDGTPTEALPLADQGAPALPPPAAAPVAAAPAKRSHTRTILEVVGGVVAAGLIVVAAGVGFVVGHATSGDGHWGAERDERGWQSGPDANGPLGQQGPQGLPGQQGQPGQLPGFGPGQDPRGIDPDGDNWTGGGMGPGMGPGMGDDMGPGMGIDPDGDFGLGGDDSNG